MADRQIAAGRWRGRRCNSAAGLAFHRDEHRPLSPVLRILIGGILLAGCASGPSPQLEAARDGAGREYFGCLLAAAQQIDNGSQDTLTVALAVKTRCGAQWLGFAKLAASNLNPRGQAQFIVDRDAKRLEEAAEAVAVVRTRKARPS